MSNLVYRMGVVDDLERVYSLNKALFSEAWSKASLLQVMQSGFNLFVCENDNELAGYLLSQDVLDEVHIMQVAVLPAYQRQGIAKQLSQMLLDDKAHQAMVFLEVRLSNIAAQALYVKLGFEKIGQRKGYYVPKDKHADWEDAVVMQLMMN